LFFRTAEQLACLQLKFSYYIYRYKHIYRIFSSNITNVWWYYLNWTGHPQIYYDKTTIGCTTVYT
jgi:hypothetical protein